MANQVTLEKGKRYIAGVKLGFIESLATNDFIKELAESHGFTNVLVTGSATDREVLGEWSGDTITFDIPSQIVTIDEVVENGSEENKNS